MEQYREKLKEAKKLYESANDDQKHVLESLFPELKWRINYGTVQRKIRRSQKALMENKLWNSTKKN